MVTWLAATLLKSAKRPHTHSAMRESLLSHYQLTNTTTIAISSCSCVLPQADDQSNPVYYTLTQCTKWLILQPDFAFPPCTTTVSFLLLSTDAANSVGECTSFKSAQLSLRHKPQPVPQPQCITDASQSALTYTLSLLAKLQYAWLNELVISSCNTHTHLWKNSRCMNYSLIINCTLTHTRTTMASPDTSMFTSKTFTLFTAKTL